MDLPTQQPPLPADARRVDTVEQIERQVDGIPGPQILSETPVKDKSMLVNLLAGFGILVVGAIAVVFLLFIPFGGKKTTTNSTTTTTTMQLGSLPNVVVETEYVNPFAASSQYTNPFIATKNPFTVFAQQ